MAGVPIDGERLQALRVARGLRQEDVAARAGVSRATILRAESPDASPRLGVLQRLAAALGMEPAELMARVRRDD